MNEAFNLQDDNSAKYNVTDGEGIKNSEIKGKERLFTQGELEKILEERLKRERKGLDSLQRLKELLRFLGKKGILKSSSNSALAEELIFLLEQNIRDGSLKRRPEEQENQRDAQNEENPGKKLDAERVNPNAENSKAPETEEIRGIIPDEARNSVPRRPAFPAPEFSDGNERAETERPEAERTAAGDPSMPGNHTERHGVSEISEFLRKYGERELSAILKSKAFISFCVGKRGTITQLYEQYIDFLNELKSASEAQKYRIAETSLASTGFSGADISAKANDYTPILSKRQMQIAKNAGMTLKEYAEMLDQIPNPKTGKRNSLVK